MHCLCFLLLLRSDLPQGSRGSRVLTEREGAQVELTRECCKNLRPIPCLRRRVIFKVATGIRSTVCPLLVAKSQAECITLFKDYTDDIIEVIEIPLEILSTLSTSWIGLFRTRCTSTLRPTRFALRSELKTAARVQPLMNRHFHRCGGGGFSDFVSRLM